MSVYMPKINYILLIYRNLFLSPTYTSKLLLLNSLIEFLGAKTDIHGADSPTLTCNKIGRHVSCLVRTRVASIKSP